MGWQSNTFAEDALQAEDLEPGYADGCSGQVQPMQGYGERRWSGNAQLLCRTAVGGSVTLKLRIEREQTVSTGAYMTLASDYGIVRFYLDGKPIGAPFDGYAPVGPSGRIPLGKVTLSAGAHRFMVQVKGYNLSSKGTLFGLDCLSLKEEIQD